MVVTWQMWLKIGVAIGTVLVAAICGFIVLKKNPSYSLNQFFTGFYLSGAIGFLFYTIYHIYGIYKPAIIPLMVTGHIFMNFGLSCLLQTEFILENASREAMTFPYLALSGGLFLISSAGYIVPGMVTLNEAEYLLGIIDTSTQTWFFISVNVYRLAVLLYVIIKYAIMTKTAKGITIKRMKIFTYSLIIAIAGIVFNVFGGAVFSGYTEFSFEILGMLTFVVGLIFMLRAFLLKEHLEEPEYEKN